MSDVVLTYFINSTLEGNLFVKLDCERVRIKLESTTFSSPSVTNICHRDACVKGAVFDVLGRDVLWYNTYRYRRFGSMLLFDDHLQTPFRSNRFQ